MISAAWEGYVDNLSGSDRRSQTINEKGAKAVFLLTYQDRLDKIMDLKSQSDQSRWHFFLMGQQ